MKSFSMKKPILIALLLLGAVATQALKPDTLYPYPPWVFGLIYEETDIQTSDDIRIKTWFFPAQDPAELQPDSLLAKGIPAPGKKPFKTLDPEPRPTIVIANGDGGNMFYLLYYVKEFCTHGFNVLTFDWRGFGESETWPIKSGYLCHPEFLLDYEAAIDYAKSRKEVDPQRIAVFGVSTGAYLSFGIAAKRGDVAAFAGRGTITTFDEVLPVLHKLKPGKEILSPPGYPENLLPGNAATAVNFPVYLIVGEDDPNSPAWMSEAIYARLKGPKKLWIVPGAGHGGEAAPESVQPEEFFGTIVDFFRQNM